MGEQNGREWWPADWLDEISPPGRSTPDQFVIRAHTHWLGYAFGAEDVSEEQVRLYSRRLEDGDVVPFCCFDDLGTIVVKVAKDRSFTVAGHLDPKASWFWEEGNPEASGDTLEEVVRVIDDVGGFENYPVVEVTVRVGWWSPPIPHRFEETWSAGLESIGRFVQVAGEAAQ